MPFQQQISTEIGTLGKKALWGAKWKKLKNSKIGSSSKFTLLTLQVIFHQDTQLGKLNNTIASAPHVFYSSFTR